jgi:uncharacterized membrane protein YeaQ/YmgE (transglycosylase-associated protein family)
MVITGSLILGWIITGLVIGGLARLLVPGRQHIGILLTLLIGIAGAIIGGLITVAVIGAGHAIVTFIVSLIVAALLVSALTTRGYSHYRRNYSRGGTTTRRRAWLRW